MHRAELVFVQSDRILCPDEQLLFREGNQIKTSFVREIKATVELTDTDWWNGHQEELLTGPEAAPSAHHIDMYYLQTVTIIQLIKKQSNQILPENCS